MKKLHLRTVFNSGSIKRFGDLFKQPSKIIKGPTKVTGKSKDSFFVLTYALINVKTDKDWAFVHCKELCTWTSPHQIFGWQCSALMVLIIYRGREGCVKTMPFLQPSLLKSFQEASGWLLLKTRCWTIWIFKIWFSRTLFNYVVVLISKCNHTITYCPILTQKHQVQWL